MRYMYTSKPDDECHEICGVYGRPVNKRDEQKYRAKGWVYDPAELKKAEPIDENYQAAVDLYVQKFGKKPHHKMKTDSILKEIEDSIDDQAQAGESNTDVTGD